MALVVRLGLGDTMSFLTASAHRNVDIFFCLVVLFDKKR